MVGRKPGKLVGHPPLGSSNPPFGAILFILLIDIFFC